MILNESKNDISLYHKVNSNKELCIQKIGDNHVSRKKYRRKKYPLKILPYQHPMVNQVIPVFGAMEIPLCWANLIF